MIPKSKSLREIVSNARSHEETCRWALAAHAYERAFDAVLRSGKASEAGEFGQKIGLCYHKAAMQASDSGSFARHMRLAARAYGNAAALYKRLSGKEAAECKCLALESYARYWLALSPVKKNHIERFEVLTAKALELYNKSGDERGFGEAYNQLQSCKCESDIDRLAFEWNHQLREKTVLQALELGEKAVDIFSHLKDDHELAKSYSVIGRLCNAAQYLTASEELKKEYGQKGWSYLQKAVELSEKKGDLRLHCSVNIWLGISAIDWAGDIESSLKAFEEASRLADKVGDQYLRGHASHCLAYGYSWKCKIEQDPDIQKQLLTKAIALEEDAFGRFLISSFVPVSSWVLADCYSSLAQEEADPGKRRELLEKAVNAGREMLGRAERWGYLSRPDWGLYHGLSKALYFLASVETVIDVKRQLCKEALSHREQSVRIVEEATPFDYWNRGVFRNYLGLLNAELAGFEVDSSSKRGFLEKAVQDIGSSIEFCSKRLRVSPKASLYATVGRYEENYANTLSQLHSLTGDVENLRGAVEAHEASIEAYNNVGWSNRVAESYWQIAICYNKLGEYLEAARNYELASKNYGFAAEKTAQLKEFYLDYVIYMRTWNEIEKGRYYHDAEEYAQSRKHYQEAAALYKSSKSWRYLAENYLAWAQLEHGEDLSRKEKGEEAVQAFQEAAELFVEAKKSFEETLLASPSQRERDKVSDLCKATDVRRQYCLGRVLLEEGRLCDGKGDTGLSASKYGLAAKVFRKVAEALERPPEREEILPIVYSCQAWEKMKLGERKVSPEFFLESAELFQRAKEHSSKERTSLLALGNSAFCRALEAGTKFEATGDLLLYSTAKQNMERSADHYLKAGFEKAATWVNACEALLDAYVYMNNAETEVAHEKKVQFYQLAEKYLERSLQLFGKADYKGKKDEVSKILSKVQEKRAFALSLSEALRAPTIISSTELITVPTAKREEAVGLDKFEHGFLQANLEVPEEATVGEAFEVRLDLANVAKEPALVVRVEDVLPPHPKVTGTLSKYEWEDGSINLGSRRLDPQQVDAVRILFVASESGILRLNPKIVYVDELGKFRACHPDPAIISVYPPGKFQFSTNQGQRAFDYLCKAFDEDYMKRRYTLEKSGWRTLMQIAQNAKISKTSVYGTGTRRGTAIAELVGRGLVEMRIFTEERGRGGKITKARIAYEKDIIKRHMDQKMMKIQEK